MRAAVEQNDKQRFAISPNGKSIRANQGHSVKIDLGLPVVAPPDQLFHGTAERFLNSIKEAGLISKSRQHVHLSDDKTTAEAVGRRHGKPIVLSVRAKDMHACGSAFYFSDNGVWLTESVPVEYIEFGN